MTNIYRSNWIGKIRVAIGLFLIALSVAHIVTSGTVAALTSSSSVTPVFTWSNTGPVGQELSGPYNVAIASNGNVYVVDTGNNAIKEFTSSGTLVRQWGGAGSGNGQFNVPTGIGVASNGDVYVMDMMNYRVQRFDDDGTYITSWGASGFGDGEFVFATALTLGSNGNIYIADSARGIIQEFTSSGSFIKKWDIESGPATVYGIATSNSGDVYITLPTLGLVERYSDDGTFISSWGSDGTGDGQFGVSSGVGPVGITVTANDHVYVTDGGNHRIQEFTTAGSFVAKWGTSGSGNGQFNLPFGVVSDGTGNMYIADNGNNRIQRYFFPQNISSITAGVAEINITLPEGCDISDHTLLSPTKTDKAYNYPLGLTSFTFSTPDCVSGATVPVSLVFQTDLKPSEVVARKYNSNTQTYSTISDAVITQTTIDGKPALQLSYSVTDGGPLDEDGVANGIIVDPVGLGTLADTPTIGAPNAGVGPSQSSMSLVMLLVLASLSILTLGIFAYRLKKNQ